MKHKTRITLENLRLAIHGVTSPFSCAGTFVSDKPVVIVVKDQTRVEVTRAKSAFDQQSALKLLLECCQPAPFGEGKGRGTIGGCATRSSFKPRKEGLRSRTSIRNRPGF